MAKQYSQSEVDALLARAQGADPTTRPYRVIKDASGTVVCYPPTNTPNAVAGHNGPWTIGDQHPDDWYNVDKDGVAQDQLAADKAVAPAAAPKAADTSPVAKAAASAADDAEYQQYLKDKAARDAAAGGTN